MTTEERDIDTLIREIEKLRAERDSIGSMYAIAMDKRIEAQAERDKLRGERDEVRKALREMVAYYDKLVDYPDVKSARAILAKLAPTTPERSDDV